MSETISREEMKQNGCQNDVSVEVGEYGRDFGSDYVIQIIISERRFYARSELEWAALTLAEAHDLYDELHDAIKKAEKLEKDV